MISSKTKKINLRKVFSEDIPELSANAGRIFGETYRGMMPEEDLQAYITTAFNIERIRSEWMNPDCLFMIAYCGGEWAGYLKLNWAGRPERHDVRLYIEIERLYIFERFHGCKVGTTLMDYALRYAREKGFDAIWLNVWERNTKAMDFYLKQGFVTMDSSIFLRGNDPQRAIWMKKALNQLS